MLMHATANGDCANTITELELKLTQAGGGGGGESLAAPGSQTCISSSTADPSINHQATSPPTCCSNFMGQQSICPLPLHQWVVLYSMTLTYFKASRVSWSVEVLFPIIWLLRLPGLWKQQEQDSFPWKSTIPQKINHPPKNLKKFWASNYDLSCYANKILSQSICLPSQATSYTYLRNCCSFNQNSHCSHIFKKHISTHPFSLFEKAYKCTHILSLSHTHTHNSLSLSLSLSLTHTHTHTLTHKTKQNMHTHTLSLFHTHAHTCMLAPRYVYLYIIYIQTYPHSHTHTNSLPFQRQLAPAYRGPWWCWWSQSWPGWHTRPSPIGWTFASDRGQWHPATPGQSGGPQTGRNCPAKCPEIPWHRVPTRGSQLQQNKAVLLVTHLSLIANVTCGLTRCRLLSHPALSLSFNKATKTGVWQRDSKRTKTQTKWNYDLIKHHRENDNLITSATSNKNMSMWQKFRFLCLGATPF